MAVGDGGLSPTLRTLRTLRTPGAGYLGVGPFVPRQQLPMGMVQVDPAPWQPQILRPILFALTNLLMPSRGVGPLIPSALPPWGSVQVDPIPFQPRLLPPLLWAIKTTMRRLFWGRALPLPAATVSITGISRDSTGVALAGCTCTLFRVRQSVADDGSGRGTWQYVQVAQAVSDGSGNYSFVVGFDGPYRVTFDLAGAPVRAGLTLNTLSGA